MSSTFKNLKFMQRAAQRDEKTAKILEETGSDMNLFFYGPPKRCVVILEGDPHPPNSGRLSFNPETWSTGNNGGLKRKQTGEDSESVYPNKLPKTSENGLRLSEETLARSGGYQGYMQGAQGSTRSMTCYRCGRTGHRALECREREKICYRCQRAGHISLQCPQNPACLLEQPTDQANKGAVTSSTSFQQKTISNQLKSEDSEPPEPNTNSNKQRSNGTDEVTPVPVRGKICYECKETGHIASACPKKQPTDQANEGAVTRSAPFQQKTISDQANFYQSRSNGSNVVAPECVSWKIEQRKCFNCGEKDHLSSACLLEQLTDRANKGALTSSTSFQQRPISNQLKGEDSEPPEPNTNSNQHRSKGINEVTPVPNRWKICYKCKETGHIASACPKKQLTDQAIKEQ